MRSGSASQNQRTPPLLQNPRTANQLRGSPNTKAKSRLSRWVGRGSRPTGQQFKRLFLIYRARNKKNIFSENGRNRRNRVTLGKKLLYYIDLEETQSEKQNCNVTRVCVTSKGQKCVKGVAAKFFKKYFSGYI